MRHYDEFIAVADKKGYKIFDKNLSINIWGVRHSLTKVKFDDEIYLFWKDGGRLMVERFEATTTPGRRFATSGGNSQGTLIMLPNQYRGVYDADGLHNRSRPDKAYNALEQVKDMEYVRDNLRDGVYRIDGNEHFWDNPKTNIHRANRLGTTTVVGRYSEGCQVITGQRVVNGKLGPSFDYFMELVRQSCHIYGREVSYTLVNNSDFL